MINTTKQNLEIVRCQIEQTKLYIQFWIAMATTGAIKQRKLQRGREVTEDERAAGMTIAWRDMTDQEKIDDAMLIASNHMERLRESYDFYFDALKT